MGANPILGVFLHWLGGLASASFYVPYRGLKRWAWETYWLMGGALAGLSFPGSVRALFANGPRTHGTC